MKAIRVDRSGLSEIDIANTLDALQAAVLGYIEVVTLVPGQAAMVVNEEGRLHQMPPNILASAIAGVKIMGPAIVVGVDDDEFTDVPAEVARHIMARFGG
ncbi:DUF3846 domain-containing protein [Ruminococcus flavefaciens]|uniref:Uncharacterized protein DUF3846 n=1 Tax=Ruminococcus flavefaciens TaxID=1265 RepID=A0A315Y2D5_RUMFL|nr:DUF3846 domain-containing protein [Ruminococcus flavefaciens]PWJ14637.1 uncharacterized protein DUF3846 [Ruminococcus flavefaciens]SSA42667.1 protein of unknown function [Ruminococcus flavefaciens]